MFLNIIALCCKHNRCKEEPNDNRSLSPTLTEVTNFGQRTGKAGVYDNLQCSGQGYFTVVALHFINRHATFYNIQACSYLR